MGYSMNHEELQRPKFQENPRKFYLPHLMAQLTFNLTMARRMVRQTADIRTFGAGSLQLKKSWGCNFLFTYRCKYLTFRLFMFSCQVVTPVPNIEYKENKGKTESWKNINLFSSKLKVPERKVPSTFRSNFHDIFCTFFTKIWNSIEFPTGKC